MAGQALINVGFGNYVLTSRVVAIVNPLSSPMRRLREEAKEDGRLVDATQGRKTRSILITDSNHVILSAISPNTIEQRVQSQRGASNMEGEGEERREPAKKHEEYSYDQS